MNIEFKNFDEFERGILYKQLVEGYSFDSRWKECFENDWKEYDDFFYDNLIFTNKCGFVTVLNDNPIGHISWDPRNAPESILIGHNCIIPEFKGNGYGKEQLKEAINRITKNNDINKIKVTTNERLLPARHNYESVGFKITQNRENTDTPFSGEYLDYEINLEKNKR